MAEPTYEELKARVAKLERQAGRAGNLDFKVGENGVSVYGLGRFPVTLSYEQWVRLLDAAQDLLALGQTLNKHRIAGRQPPSSLHHWPRFRRHRLHRASAPPVAWPVSASKAISRRLAIQRTLVSSV